MKKRVAVIGAGIAGLACAYELQRNGCEVVVFEKNSYVGGRMSSRTKDGFIFDLGADHLADLYEEMKAYCAEFGLSWIKMDFLKYQLLKNGNLVSFKDAVGPLAKMRLAMVTLFAKRGGNFLDLDELAKFDTDNAYDFMKQKCGQEVADYYVDPFTSTYQFHRAKEISLGALVGILKSISTNLRGWHLHHIKGGMQALPDAFASRLNMKMNTPVVQVVGVGAHGNAPVRLTVKNSTEEQFDAVVLASTGTVSASIYQNPTEAQVKVMRSARYASSISLAFKVDRSRMPDTAVVWVPFVENQKISGYVNESMKGAETTHDGKSLFCVWLHEGFAREVMQKSDEEIFSLVKNEVLKVCPWFTSVEQLANHDLERWPEAMPKFYHGHLTTVAEFMRNGQGARNVFLCGDYMNGPWTEGALRNGKKVANQVIASFRA